MESIRLRPFLRVVIYSMIKKSRDFPVINQCDEHIIATGYLSDGLEFSAANCEENLTDTG